MWDRKGLSPPTIPLHGHRSGWRQPSALYQKPHPTPTSQSPFNHAQPSPRRPHPTLEETTPHQPSIILQWFAGLKGRLTGGGTAFHPRQEWTTPQTGVDYSPGSQPPTLHPVSPATTPEFTVSSCEPDHTSFISNPNGGSRMPSIRIRTRLVFL